MSKKEKKQLEKLTDLGYSMNEAIEILEIKGSFISSNNNKKSFDYFEGKYQSHIS